MMRGMRFSYMYIVLREFVCFLRRLDVVCILLVPVKSCLLMHIYEPQTVSRFHNQST